jgi:hypothetical protein
MQTISCHFSFIVEKFVVFVNFIISEIFLRLCPGVRIRLDFRAGMNKPRRATFYTVLLKGGFSLDFQAFSQFDNAGCKTCYFLDLTELHNKKG